MVVRVREPSGTWGAQSGRAGSDPADLDGNRRKKVSVDAIRYNENIVVEAASILLGSGERRFVFNHPSQLRLWLNPPNK